MRIKDIMEAHLNVTNDTPVTNFTNTEVPDPEHMLDR